jgi:ABC-type nitrate/sulfonate/bicarbonate transport system ATPase subunit
MTPKLATRNLSKRFDGLEALRDLNVEIERGGFVSVVGPSGCGKTTFLRIVAGLETASAGEVLLDGHLVRGPGRDRGFVFQADSLLPWRTVLGNAMIGPEVAGRNGGGRSSSSSWSAWRASRPIIRASCPGACASASISPARSPSIRRSC